MPLETRYFGLLPDDTGLALDFPAGIPAFDRETVLVLLTPPETAPIVFLQSKCTPELCFLAVAVEQVLPHYELALSAEDLVTAGFPPDRMPPTDEVVVLAILTAGADQMTANLLAPVVINTPLHRAVQAVRSDRMYSSCYPVRLDGIEASACS